MSKEKTIFYTNVVYGFIVLLLSFIIGIPDCIRAIQDVSAGELLGFVSVAAALCYPSILYLRKGEISFSEDKISIFRNKDYPPYQDILLSNISKAEINADNNLIFYNYANDIDCIFDMNKQLRKNERQLFINTLSKRVFLIIDSQIAEKNNYTLPENAIREENTSRRREAILNAEPYGNRNTAPNNARGNTGGRRVVANNTLANDDSQDTQETSFRPSEGVSTAEPQPNNGNRNAAPNSARGNTGRRRVVANNTLANDDSRDTQETSVRHGRRLEL